MLNLPARSRFGRGKFQHLTATFLKMPKQIRHDHNSRFYILGSSPCLKSPRSSRNLFLASAT